MSKDEKLLQRLSRKPTDFKWSEMKTLLDRLGFTLLDGDGSRVKFFNSEKNVLINLHKPHPGNIVKVGAIKDVIVTLKDMGVEL